MRPIREAVLAITLLGPLATLPPTDVRRPPEALVREWKLSPFYKKYVDASGFPILSSESVSDYALHEARHLIDKLLEGRDDVRAALIKNRVRFVVQGVSEMTTTIPEYSDLTPAKYW